MLKFSKTATLFGFALAASVVAPLAAMAQTAGITVYAAGPLDVDRALTTAFTKATGTPVELWDSTTGKILARLQAEQSNPHADVVMLADQSAGLEMQQQGLLMPYRPSAIVAKLRPGLDTPSDFLPSGADTVAIVVNSQNAGAPKGPISWNDFTAAAFKDQVSMPDPTLSGTAADFVLGFMQQPGVDGWAYFSKLKANGTIWPGPNDAALAPVKIGDRSVLMAAVGHTALEAMKQGNSLSLVMPKDGTLFIPRPIVIMKSSPHSDEAKKFVDFVLSPAGQKIVSKFLLIPAVKDVPAAPEWPNLDNTTFWKVDWDKMAKDRSAVLKRFGSTIVH